MVGQVLDFEFNDGVWVFTMEDGSNIIATGNVTFVGEKNVSPKVR
jgi:hypothetical protein